MNSNNPYGDLLPNLISILLMGQQVKKPFNDRSQEEQDQINAKWESDKENKRVKEYIQQGICPYCEGKLIRGKKDKKNNYKRTWNCVKCEKDLIN